MEMLRARRGEGERREVGRRTEGKDGGTGKGMEGGGGQRERETKNKEREDLRVSIANFPYIKGTYRESKRWGGNRPQWF